MKILKFKRGPEATDPDLLVRLEAIASRGRVEGAHYPTLEMSYSQPAVHRVFSTLEEIAAEHGAL